MSASPPTGPAPSMTPAAAPQPGNQRLLSLDALRGFDMFWIIGGRDFFLAAAGFFVTEQTLARWNAEATHPQWSGYTFSDLIFPLFIFVVGVAIPFSLDRRVERGESLGRVYWHILRRTVLLILLGLICNNRLLALDFAHQRLPSVLGRIGLAYCFASILTLHASTRGRVIWLVAILAGYWAAMTYIPVPGHGPGRFDTQGATLADYVDHHLLPGRVGPRKPQPAGTPKLYRNDPEGILSTIPSIATALLGVLAGGWLRESRRNGHVKAAALLIAGAICWGLSQLWDPYFPIQKKIWTSSFVLWTGGWSLMLLGAFYWIIDVWGWKRWAFFFVVIGTNAITIYILIHFVDFKGIGEFVFSRAPLHKDLLPSCGRLAIEWLLLYVLYRNRIFLRL